MSLPNIFSKPIADQVIERINKLTPNTQPAWGKMNVAQMLAHCNVTYEMAFENIHPKPSAFMRFIMKAIVKKYVTGEAPFKRHSKTAPAFIITGDKDFEKEKNRLIDYIHRTQRLGELHFDNKESHSFGALNKEQWNNMFYKHLDHHLTQFGV